MDVMMRENLVDQRDKDFPLLFMIPFFQHNLMLVDGLIQRTDKRIAGKSQKFKHSGLLIYVFEFFFFFQQLF